MRITYETATGDMDDEQFDDTENPFEADLLIMLRLNSKFGRGWTEERGVRILYVEHPDEGILDYSE